MTFSKDDVPGSRQDLKTSKLLILWSQHVVMIRYASDGVAAVGGGGVGGLAGGGPRGRK